MKRSRVIASDDCTGECLGTKLELNLKIKLLHEFKITLRVLKIIILKYKILLTIRINFEFLLLIFECTILNLNTSIWRRNYNKLFKINPATNYSIN